MGLVVGCPMFGGGRPEAVITGDLVGVDTEDVAGDWIESHNRSFPCKQTGIRCCQVADPGEILCDRNILSHESSFKNRQISIATCFGMNCTM